MILLFEIKETKYGVNKFSEWNFVTLLLSEENNMHKTEFLSLYRQAQHLKPYWRHPTDTYGMETVMIRVLVW
jgi:hypothetical protein